VMSISEHSAVVTTTATPRILLISGKSVRSAGRKRNAQDAFAKPLAALARIARGHQRDQPETAAKLDGLVGNLIADRLIYANELIRIGMTSDIEIFENTLRPLTPHFEQALGRTMPVERLMRSIMISIERNPKLLAANRQTLLNAAMSAACLGLEVDGATGQAFLVPFSGKVQIIIGYKGYNTLGARAGLTITGEVVRDGDAFDYDLGEGYVTHKPKLGNQGPIVAAWAKAAASNRPPIVSVLGIDDLMAIMARSPAVKGGFDTPWKEKIIGFPAMCSKSAKRRLARSTPLNVMQVAAAMEEAHEERGKLSWIDPARGVQIEGEFHDGPQINHDQRSTDELLTLEPTLSDDAIAWDSKLQTAAMQGPTALEDQAALVPKHLRKALKQRLDEIHRPAAAAVIGT
jgi:phage RecT family recombinase